MRAAHARRLGILAVLLAFFSHGAFGGEDAEEAQGIDWLVFPFPVHAPETGWAITLSAIAAGAIGEAPPSSVIAAISWSEKNQKSLSFDAALNVDRHWRTEGRIAFEDWPTQYFGLGNDTDADDEEMFEARQAELDVTVQREVAPRIWLGPRIVWREHRVDDVADGGLLEAQPPLGIDGGTFSGLGLVASYDSRDDLYAPQAGQYVTAGFALHSGALGSDFSFRQFTLDARQFVSVRPEWVLALHQYLEATRGSIPFQELPRLGDTAPPVRLRGHMTGRFRDRNAVALQGELRFPLRGRFGGVAFAGVGQVAPTFGAMSPSDLHWSGGAGLRFQALRGQRIHLRLDVAAGSDETGIYFSILEAF